MIYENSSRTICFICILNLCPTQMFTWDYSFTLLLISSFLDKLCISMCAWARIFACICRHLWNKFICGTTIEGEVREGLCQVNTTEKNNFQKLEQIFPSRIIDLSLTSKRKILWSLDTFPDINYCKCKKTVYYYLLISIDLYWIELKEANNENPKL